MELNIVVVLTFWFVERNSECFDDLGVWVSTLDENIEVALNGYFELVEVRIMVVDSVESRNNHFNVN